MKNIKGIIFDMDNTLLRSTIDFPSMKRGTYKFLTTNGVLPPDLELSNHTTATIIEEAIGTGCLSETMKQEMWEIVTSFELEGMKGAGLETGVVEILDELKDNYVLTVVTNNSLEAAETALQGNGVREYFET